LGTLAGKRWGNMRQDIDSTWIPFQKKLIDNHTDIFIFMNTYGVIHILFFGKCT
jgi:hypothetical protein